MRPVPPLPPSLLRRGTGETPTVGPRWSTGEQLPVKLRRGAAASGLSQLTDPHSQLRQQVRQNRRLRLGILAAAAVVLFAVLPAIFLVRDAAIDPVFADLDGLQLPGWAAHSHQDLSSGNRWCVNSCRLRERTWRSDKTATETDPVYRQALTEAGWRPWHTNGCPKVPRLTCWERDEYALDLYTRNIPCSLASLPPVPTGDPSASAPVPTPIGAEPPATCAGSLVSAKVANRVDPNWHP